ncbi:MAG: response regulator [Deltaproteobacteria bacterium]|nr:response regulator [Deltaproteobacteria bacterium]MBW2051049.1 response regulator [Deltaproteobacteria bacterium]MBW2140960.1 response regulator [Deltaproteobacteria bacterium]MBW2323202.1 response regulator [Deltaproteobacteria bacterium]
MTDKKINLVIVDDEEQFLDSIRKRLTIRGFNVITVNRGEKALEIIKKCPVDIVVLDLKMPGLSGEDTLKALKEEQKELEVIILTGYTSIDSELECRRMGVYDYLQKPCEWEQMLEVLMGAYKKTVVNREQIAEREKDESFKKTNSI